MSAPTATGRCLCGAVRYELRGELRGILVCHCVECRRYHGTSGAYTSVAREALDAAGPRGPAALVPGPAERDRRRARLLQPLRLEPALARAGERHLLRRRRNARRRDRPAHRAAHLGRAARRLGARRRPAARAARKLAAPPFLRSAAACTSARKSGAPVVPAASSGCHSTAMQNGCGRILDRPRCCRRRRAPRRRGPPPAPRCPGGGGSGCRRRPRRARRAVAVPASVVTRCRPNVPELRAVRRQVELGARRGPGRASPPRSTFMQLQAAADAEHRQPALRARSAAGRARRRRARGAPASARPCPPRSSAPYSAGSRSGPPVRISPSMPSSTSPGSSAPSGVGGSRIGTPPARRTPST